VIEYDGVEAVKTLGLKQERKRITMDAKELETRFTYHSPKDGQLAKYTDLRDSAKALAQKISEMVPESRE